MATNCDTSSRIRGGDRETARGLRGLSKALIGSWILLGVVSLFVWRNFTVDDAFIGWRHGRNLVEHGRYAFNPDGQLIEAATSPLYGLAGAIPTIFGVDHVLFFKLVAVSVVVYWVLIALLAKTASPTSRILFLLMALGGPVQAVHLWSGLETAVFVLLSTLICCVGLGVIDLRITTFGLLSALLVLTRIEGLFFIIPAFCLHVHSNIKYDADAAHLRERASLWLKEAGRQTSALLPSLALLAILSIARWIYFGSPLPNTFVTKSGQSISLPSMVVRVTMNLREFIPILIAAVILGLLISPTVQRRYVFLVVVSGGLGLLLYLPSDLQMNYASRFPFQLLWPSVLAAVLSIKQIKLRELFGVFAAAVSLTLFVTGDLVDYYPRMTNAMLPLGEALGQNVEKRGTVVMGDAGQVPFVSDWNLLDTNFLTTPASFAIDGIAKKIEQRSSTVLALYAEGPSPAEVRDSQAALVSAAQSSGYFFVGSVTWRDDYWFHLWVSPDLASNENLKRGLLEVVETSRNENFSLRIRDAIKQWFWNT